MPEAECCRCMAAVPSNQDGNSGLTDRGSGSVSVWEMLNFRNGGMKEMAVEGIRLLNEIVLIAPARRPSARVGGARSAARASDGYFFYCDSAELVFVWPAMSLRSLG
jgi:hypothetical protein